MRLVFTSHSFIHSASVIFYVMVVREEVKNDFPTRPLFLLLSRPSFCPDIVKQLHLFQSCTQLSCLVLSFSLFFFFLLCRITNRYVCFQRANRILPTRERKKRDRTSSSNIASIKYDRKRARTKREEKKKKRRKKFSLIFFLLLLEHHHQYRSPNHLYTHIEKENQDVVIATKQPR